MLMNTLCTRKTKTDFSLHTRFYQKAWLLGVLVWITHQYTLGISTCFTVH